MKYALIGCGRIAPNHLNAALSCGMDVVALCDVSEANMHAQKEAFHLKDVKLYTDYRKMLEENDIDVVSLGVASGVQPKIALDVLDYRVHLIIEKPIAMSLSDADAMIEKADRLGLKVAVCQQNRYNKAIQALRHAVEAERFGKISHGTICVRWHRDAAYYQSAAWRGTWAKDGGALMNQSIHGIDILRWMLGDEIDEIYGTLRRQYHNIEAEDLGMAIVKFKNGALATIEGTTNVYPENFENKLCLFGEKGTVVIGGTCLNEVQVWKFSDETEADEAYRSIKEQTANIYGNGHALIFADMKKAIEENRAPYVDIHCGRRALELIVGIYKSQKEGRAIKFPVTNFGTTDMQGVNF